MLFTAAGQTDSRAPMSTATPGPGPVVAVAEQWWTVAVASLL